MAEKGMRVMVYDQNLVPQYPMTGYKSLTVQRDINAVGVATLVIRGDHPRRSDLHVPGRRVVITDPNGAFLLSGPVTNPASTSPARNSDVTIVIEDDATVFGRVLGWVNPAAGPEAQQSDSQQAVWSQTSPAETAFKALVSANFSRLGLAHQVALSQGRGKTITLTSRMSKLSDVIFPACTVAGILPVVRQQPTVNSGQEVIVDCLIPTTRAPILTVQSPQITGWTYSMQSPTAFGGVAGGSGQGTARVFVAYEDTALRQAWGPYWAGELFSDQRQETTQATLLAALKADVAAAGPSVAMQVTLSETDSWQYGIAWDLGDYINVKLVDSAPVQTIQITQVIHTHSPDKGYQVTSQCSPPTTSKSALKAAYQLARRIRHLETGA